MIHADMESVVESDPLYDIERFLKFKSWMIGRIHYSEGIFYIASEAGKFVHESYSGRAAVEYLAKNP